MQDPDEPMTQPTFEQLRIPAALVLILVAVFVFLPRGDKDPTTTAGNGADSTATAGQPGGAVLATPAPTPMATATDTLALGPTATPDPTPEPTQAVADTFQAEVLACRLIAGSNCIGRLGTLSSRAGNLTALVRFSDANAGDAIAVSMSGPGGTIAGGPFTLQGGGDGYYYSTFPAGGLPNGEYTLVATRNGTEVAQTTFRRGR